MVQIVAMYPEPTRAERSRPPHRAQSRPRKREILDAASRVFRRNGLHATGMREIAAELGMAVGNLYYYFRDKEELLAYVQEEALAGLIERAREVEARGLSADAALYVLFTEHVVRLNDPIEGTPGSLAHLEVEALGERSRAAVLARREEYERALTRWIERGVAGGIFRAVEPRLAAQIALGALNWTVKWFRPEGSKSAREIGAESAELLVRGLLAADRSFVPPSAPAADLESEIEG